jgi:hypothetical protein
MDHGERSSISGSAGGETPKMGEQIDRLLEGVFFYQNSAFKTHLWHLALSMEITLDVFKLLAPM